MYDTSEPCDNTFLYTLTALSCIGGFLFGYDTGVISGALVQITDKFDLTEWEKELVVSITVGGACMYKYIYIKLYMKLYIIYIYTYYVYLLLLLSLLLHIYVYLSLLYLYEYLFMYIYSDFCHVFRSTK